MEPGIEDVTEELMGELISHVPNYVEMPISYLPNPVPCWA